MTDRQAGDWADELAAEFVDHLPNYDHFEDSEIAHKWIAEHLREAYERGYKDATHVMGPE